MILPTALSFPPENMVYDEDRAMTRSDLQEVSRRPPVVIVALAIVAILGFVLVTHLVNRFAEQQKALARHLYAQGVADRQSGNPERAVEEFRTAVFYSRDSFEYQLALARALRDTGRTNEAEAYLITLWERSPQDGAVNLALARLSARQNSLDKTIQYYHNAIYGVWPVEADASRLNAWFELVETLLRMKARPQAQAELITLSAELPHRVDLQLRAADLFMEAQDYEHALTEYRQILRSDRGNGKALEGAGEASFHLARFNDAERYLQAAVNSQDSDAEHLLELTRMILASDPFDPRLSVSERSRRVRAAFDHAGDRLQSCSKSLGLDLQSESTPGNLEQLNLRWVDLKQQLTRRSSSNNEEILNSSIDLVFQIEQETQKECGAPTGIDQALLLLAQNRVGAEP